MQSIGDVLANRVDMKKYDAMVDEIMENNEIQSFISENELSAEQVSKSYSKFYEFIKEKQKFNSDSIGFEPFLTLNGNFVEVSYRETEAHIAKRKHAEQVMRLNRNSIIPDMTVKNATFKSFVTKTEEEKAALKFSIDTAQYYRDGGEGNTIFSGPAGTGKSHLSMSILKSCLEDEGMSVIFASFSEVLHLIKDSFNNKQSKYTQEYFMSLFRKTDLLVLDDIGSEQITEWSETLLTDVLDGRTKTIITTNLSSSELNKKYNQRIYSRLMRGIGKKAFNFKNIKDKRVTQLPF